MEDFTPHELRLMEKMTPQHRALMAKLNQKERASLAENVKPEDVDLIQSWIGTDEEIERMLFWDKWGKYDDPEWHSLEPVDDVTAVLYDKARARFREMRREAVEIQRRSDLTLYSQFNDGLLFTGLAGAVRCNREGVHDEEGGFFRGVEWRCVGSVEEFVNSITLMPHGEKDFRVHFGSDVEGRAAGIWVYTGDTHSLLQLAQLSQKILPRDGYETRVSDKKANIISLDPREIRKAAMGEGKVDYGEELNLKASVDARDPDESIEAAARLSKRLYERFGLEIECHHIGKKYGNFYIMRDENFERLLPETPVDHRGLILITATLICRRCRREIEEFRDLARSYPEARIALVNLASPQFKFYERVFGDMGSGDSDRFRKTAAGVTPFIIIYTPDEKGILRYREYVSTGKAENTPSIRNNLQIFDKYFK
ncbi:MAG: hypothetical protein JRJ29_06410 [Deltaproteobacteria bacterium]|nr:hypothetical protein [Deltaproteobacteria bacterium]